MICDGVSAEKSPQAYEVLRALASIWSCFVVYVFVFAMKIPGKTKFEEKERIARQEKLRRHQNARTARGGSGSGYAQGGTRNIRGG